MFCSVALVAALILHLFLTPVPSPSLVVDSVVPPIYSGSMHGSARLCLTNGSDRDVFFQPGIGHSSEQSVAHLWLGVERKVEGGWKLESESAKWPDSNYFKIYSINYWPRGSAAEFRVPVMADGQPRRILVRWKAAPRKLPLVLAHIRQVWYKFLPPKPPQPSSYFELRSAEVVVEKRSDYDYQAAFKRLDTNEYKPSPLPDSPLDEFGVGYSSGRKSLFEKK